jgi:hypothetical protein
LSGLFKAKSAIWGTSCAYDAGQELNRTFDLMRLYFSTPVWGDSHIELFKTIGLPSLLSPSNLPGLVEPAACRYFIYTRPQDVAQLKDCEAFRRLESLIPVAIYLLPDSIGLPYLIFAECNADTLRRADEDDVAAVFSPPDCVWADGSLANLQRLADSGKSVVRNTGVRLNKDTATPELISHRDSGAALNIPARELVELGLRNLHPVALSHFWREYEGALLPTNLYWTAPGQGLVIRCFHLHPLLVKSQIKFAHFTGTIDDDLVLSACPDPSTEYVVDDSDEILTFELSPSGDFTIPKTQSQASRLWLRWAPTLGIGNWRRTLSDCTTRRLTRMSGNPSKRKPIGLYAKQVVLMRAEHRYSLSQIQRC